MSRVVVIGGSGHIGTILERFGCTAPVLKVRCSRVPRSGPARAVGGNGPH